MVVQSLIEEFRSAVENEEYRRAREVTDEISATLNEVEADESVRAKKAIYSYTRGELPDEDSSVVHEYAQTAAATNLSRATFLTNAAAFLTAPDEFDTDQMVEIADELEENETQFDESTDEVETVIDEVSLPPIVEILSINGDDGPHGTGKPIEMTVTVGNFGDDAADDVLIDVAAETDEIDLDPESVDVGDLDPGGEESAEFSVASDASGETELLFTVSAENTETKTETERIEWEGKADLGRLAEQNVDELLERIDEIDYEESEEGLEELWAHARVARTSIESGIEHMDEGYLEDADASFQKASTLLGAFLNRLDEVSDSDTDPLSETDEVFLERHATNAIELLASARWETEPEDSDVERGIEKRDITGDENDDIWMSNERIWLQINGTDLDSETFVSTIGRGGSTELAGPWQFRLRSHDHQSELESTEAFEIVENTDDPLSYRVEQRYAIGENPLQIVYTVRLPADSDTAIVETGWTNDGSEVVLLDQPSRHVHEGIMLLRGGSFRDAAGNYRFHVSGAGTHPFDAVRRWQTFPIDGEQPFVTLFDDERAVTYALLQGATDPHHAVTGGKPANRVDFMVEELSLSPDESASYTIAIGVHDGGDVAREEAAEMLSELR